MDHEALLRLIADMEVELLQRREAYRDLQVEAEQLRVALEGEPEKTPGAALLPTATAVIQRLRKERDEASALARALVIAPKPE